MNDADLKREERWRRAKYEKTEDGIRFWLGPHVVPMQSPFFNRASNLADVRD